VPGGSTISYPPATASIGYLRPEDAAGRVRARRPRRRARPAGRRRHHGNRPAPISIASALPSSACTSSCSEVGDLGTVDHVEGRKKIALAKDEAGQHHYIPLSWVTSVDDKVHIDRPGHRAMREWSTHA
jgi:hypothetical protein